MSEQQAPAVSALEAEELERRAIVERAMAEAEQEEQQRRANLGF